MNSWWMDGLFISDGVSICIRHGARCERYKDTQWSFSTLMWPTS